jgi:hypothetical protein
MQTLGILPLFVAVVFASQAKAGLKKPVFLQQMVAPYVDYDTDRAKDAYSDLAARSKEAGVDTDSVAAQARGVYNQGGSTLSSFNMSQPDEPSSSEVEAGVESALNEFDELEAKSKAVLAEKYQNITQLITEFAYELQIAFGELEAYREQVENLEDAYYQQVVYDYEQAFYLAVAELEEVLTLVEEEVPDEVQQEAQVIATQAAAAYQEIKTAYSQVEADFKNATATYEAQLAAQAKIIASQAQQLAAQAQDEAGAASSDAEAEEGNIKTSLRAQVKNIDTSDTA